MKQLLIILLFIKCANLNVLAQDTLRTCWAGEFNINKYKSYIQFQSFVAQKNDSLYFLVNWEMFEKGMYLNAIPVSNKNIDEIQQINVTPLKHTDKESIESLGNRHVTEKLLLGNNLILIFRKVIKDKYVFNFFLYDLSGNCIKEKKIELPTFSKKTAPYEKIAFSPDGKHLLFHYRCKQVNDNSFDKLMIMDEYLETVSEADNLYSFWDPENTFDKLQENIMVNLQTSITNSGYVIIRHARYKLGVISERTEEIYSPKTFKKIPFALDLEGYMLRGDLQVIDDSSSNLFIIGSYGTIDQIKGIFTCKLISGQSKTYQLKLIPFEEKMLSLSPASDNKVLFFSSITDNKLFLVTEEEIKMNRRKLSTGYSHNSFSGGMDETTRTFYIWDKSRNNFRITLIDSSGTPIKTTCIQNYLSAKEEFPYDVTPWSSPTPGANFKIISNNLILGNLYNATNSPPPLNYFQAIKIKNAFGVKISVFNIINGDTTSKNISLSNYNTPCSELGFFLGDKGLFVNEVTKGKRACLITMFSWASIKFPTR